MTLLMCTYLQDNTYELWSCEPDKQACSSAADSAGFYYSSSIGAVTLIAQSTSALITDSEL